MNNVLHGDCLELMKDIPDNSIDLTITSPPYDNLRDYKGYTFNFEGIERVNFLFNYPFFYSFIKQGSDTS